MIIRDAEFTDIDAILTLGNDNAFAVSKHISFYERPELYEWIAERNNNIMLVAATSEQIAGFLYCKIMSCHWALLDNFYVHPNQRGHGYGRHLLLELNERLRKRGITYLSCLAIDDASLSAQLNKLGFCRTKSYAWYETFLDEPDWTHKHEQHQL